MQTSVQLYMWTVIEAIRGERKFKLSEQYQEETLLVSEDDIYLD